jgi:hypothetical protein
MHTHHKGKSRAKAEQKRIVEVLKENKDARIKR